MQLHKNRKLSDDKKRELVSHFSQQIIMLLDCLNCLKFFLFFFLIFSGQAKILKCKNNQDILLLIHIFLFFFFFDFENSIDLVAEQKIVCISYADICSTTNLKCNQNLFALKKPVAMVTWLNNCEPEEQGNWAIC